MENTILIGRGSKILRVPDQDWKEALAGAPEFFSGRLAFMTEEHHRVRNFVVAELPANQGEPLQPADISRRLGLSHRRLNAILDELERNLFFLVRNDEGAVSWAFPVTSDRTPHLVRFSNGKSVSAAGAVDAIATPFVEGRIWKENLSAEVETACAHCGWGLHLTLDDNLAFTIREQDANPLIFSPEVNWDHLRAPNIIQDFGRNSLFFWSEEHAVEFRAREQMPQGIYESLVQKVYSIKISQSALFGFSGAFPG